ncbi:MAG: polyprenol monophosphomannose synthase [Patescibacteria group bacterium]
MIEKKVIIIPTYNEAENIGGLIEEIFFLNIQNLQVIIVDDNSQDGTASIVSNLAQKFDIVLIKRPAKLGLGSAYISGFRAALASGADLIFEMDADFSHNPKLLPKFIKAIQDGAEVVIGSRRVAGGQIIGWGVWRHFCSSAASWFSRLVLGLKTLDVTSGYRCYSRTVLEKINLDKIKSNGYAFQEEMIYYCEQNGFRIKELPIVFQDRIKGRSKLSRKEVVAFFITMFRLKFLTNGR